MAQADEQLAAHIMEAADRTYAGLRQMSQSRGYDTRIFDDAAYHDLAIHKIADQLILERVNGVAEGEMAVLRRLGKAHT